MSGGELSGRSSARVEPGTANSLANSRDPRVSSNDSLPALSLLQRVRPERAEAIIASLTTRDQAIVEDVGRLRLMSGGQLQRLHFNSSVSGQRHGRRVLTSLTERRVLARLGRSVGGTRAGSAGYVYCLDVVGQRLLHPDTDVRRPSLPSAGFIRHAVMVSDCYVGLAIDARTGRLELLGFEGEPACWRHYVNRRGAHQLLKPDAFVALGLGEFEDRWFLECDRSTEDLPRVLRKCQAYVQYFRTGKEAVFPRVLWVASRPGRAAALSRLLTELPAEQRPLFAVCEAGDFLSTIARGAGEEPGTQQLNEGGER